MKVRDITHILPDIIQHKSHGYGELEILFDKRGKKAVCYRHRNGTSSFATYGKTWDEVCISLNNFFKGEGKQLLDKLPAL